MRKNAETLLPPCAVFHGKKCIPTCPNFQLNWSSIFYKAEQLNVSPEEMINIIFTSTLFNHFKNSLVQQTELPDEIVCRCIHEPKM
ncbi:MAG: hypothetical protein A2V66_10375 [Ignavibacteria bacterium RBG_13_36_8]|nr:MAG: hypothetical protein A2V66_10375 [Ignavibacteria bacterium RBG_13_36_8]